MSLPGHRLICPRTGQVLAPVSGNKLATPDGATTYPIRCGVPVVRKGNAYDGGPLFDGIETLVARMEDPDWAAALLDRLGTHLDGLPLRRVLASDTVAAWQILLPRSARGRVLYISSLLGGEAVALGRWCREVVACDANLAHAAFLKARVRQKRLDNVHVVCAGDTDTLPFPSGNFDAVLLHGLDWFREDPGLAAQVAFLREVRRVLTPDGHLWLGVENRWGLPHWAGRPDRYAGLPFFSFLPRALGDRLARGCRRRSPRAHAHGAGGYRRMLDDAGFAATRFHALVPHFRCVSELVPLDARMRPAPVPSTRWTARLKRSRWLAPAFGIAAHAVRGEESWIEALTEMLHKRLGIDGPVRFPQVMRSGADSAGLIAFLGDAAVLRLPFDPENMRRVQRNYEGLEMARDRLRAPLQIDTPEPLVSGEFDGAPFTVESRLPGVLLSRLDPSRWPAEEERMFQLLLAMQALPVEQTPDRAAQWREIVATFERAVGWATAAAERKLATEFAAMAADLDASCLPLALVHGDFKWNNMLVAGADRNLGVFDWDCWSAAGPATHDFLHYVTIRRRLRDDRPWAAAFADWLAGTGADEHEVAWTGRFEECAGLAPGWRAPAAAHYWARSITEMAGTDHDLERGWIRQNYLDLLPRMHDFARAALTATR